MPVVSSSSTSTSGRAGSSSTAGSRSCRACATACECSSSNPASAGTPGSGRRVVCTYVRARQRLGDHVAEAGRGLAVAEHERRRPVGEQRRDQRGRAGRPARSAAAGGTGRCLPSTAADDQLGALGVVAQGEPDERVQAQVVRVAVDLPGQAQALLDDRPAGCLTGGRCRHGVAGAGRGAYARLGGPPAGVEQRRRRRRARPARRRRPRGPRPARPRARAGPISFILPPDGERTTPPSRGRRARRARRRTPRAGRPAAR